MSHLGLFSTLLSPGQINEGCSDLPWGPLRLSLQQKVRTGLLLILEVIREGKAKAQGDGTFSRITQQMAETSDHNQLESQPAEPPTFYFIASSPQASEEGTTLITILWMGKLRPIEGRCTRLQGNTMVQSSPAGSEWTEISVWLCHLRMDGILGGCTPRKRVSHPSFTLSAPDFHDMVLLSNIAPGVLAGL